MVIKTKSLEVCCRELDSDESLSCSEAARCIVTELGANFNTVYSYLLAKRNGFGSQREMLLERSGFKTSREYGDSLARKKGFDSVNQYFAIKRIISGTVDEAYARSGQGRFEGGIGLLPPEEMGAISAATFEYKDDLYDMDDALGRIPEMEALVIEHRFFIGDTLKETAAELGIRFRQRIFQLEKQAICSLRTEMGPDNGTMGCYG